jgi:hypothetical protein
VGSNPTHGMDVCVYSVCVRQRPTGGLIPRQRSPTDCLRLRNWNETKRFTNALCSNAEATGIDDDDSDGVLPTRFIGDKLLWVLRYVSLADSYAGISQYVYKPTKTVPVQFKCKSDRVFKRTFSRFKCLLVWDRREVLGNMSLDYCDELRTFILRRI